MSRGELYLVRKPGSRVPKRQRVLVIVGRQVVIDSKFSTVTCAPVYSRHDGLTTQVPVGFAEGLKHDSSIHCDELLSVPKEFLTQYIGRLRATRTEELNRALAIALQLDER